MVIGQTISHYKILQKLGSGGRGEVWLAEDSKLERRVALKFLASHLVSDPEIHKRFEQPPTESRWVGFRLKVGLRLKPPEGGPGLEPAQGSAAAVIWNPWSSSSHFCPSMYSRIVFSSTTPTVAQKHPRAHRCCPQ